MKKHYRAENDCLNCGTVLVGKFCHNCGQENLQIKESFGHMMNHAISDYFHFDHQFFHTLKPLLFKPGFLTNEYMAGRRAQYLHPVKMYIFISIVYFLLLFQSGNQPVTIDDSVKKPVTKEKITGGVNKAIKEDQNLSATQKIVLQKKMVAPVLKIKADTNQKNYVLIRVAKDASYPAYLTSQQKLPESEKDGFFTRLANKRIYTYKIKYGKMAKDVFADEVKHNIPKMMFVMLPLFALVLRVAFLNNKKFYVEHLIHAFHLHCFFFIFMAIIMLLQLAIPNADNFFSWIDLAASLFVVWYIYRSLRVVYQRARWRTVSKMAGMSFIYSIVVVCCICLVIFITIITAA